MSINVEEIQTLEREKKVNNIDSTKENSKKVNKNTRRKVSTIIYVNFFKRIFDILGGIIGLILMIPITLVVWIMNVANHENGPLLYSHTRIGKNGKPFKLYKYRTMHVNADEELVEILKGNEEYRKEWEANRKLTNDPRVTKVGKFLRKTSLDEFPNFLSVIKGDLSIVGPRAVIPNELEKFGDKADIILSVKPGITGYWAANGRSNTTYEERVQMETYYAENISFTLDLKILLKTISQVLKKDGAI